MKELKQSDSRVPEETATERRMRLRRETIAALTGNGPGPVVFMVNVSSTSQHCS